MSELLLWGVNAEAEELAGRLAARGIAVAGYVDGYREAGSHRGLPLYAPEQLPPLFAEQGELPLVATAHSAAGEARLQQLTEVLVNRLKRPQERLWPAAAVAYALGEGLGGRVLVSGLPGSGNMLAVRLIERLAGPPPAGPPWPALGAAVNRQKLALLREVAGLSGALASCATSDRFGRLTFTAAASDGVVELYGIPATPFSEGRTQHLHDLPPPEQLAWLLRQGARLVLPLRHPLDVLVSNAHKLEPNVVAWLQVRRPGWEVAAIRAELAALRLGEPQWVRNTLGAIAAQSRALLQLARGHLLRYEALLADPEGQLLALADYLALPVDRAAVLDAWQALGLRPLPGVSRHHFNQPGSGKWQQLLNRGHLPLLEGLGIGTLLEELGYAAEWNRLGAAPDAPPADPLLRAAAVLHDAMFCERADFPAAFDGSTLRRITGTIGAFGNSERLLQGFGWLLQSPSGRAFLEAPGGTELWEGLQGMRGSMANGGAGR